MEPGKVLGKILQGFQPARILMTANAVDLFDAIADAPATAAEVADRLSLSEKGALRLLNALTALGMVSRQGDRFRLIPEFTPYLTAGGAKSMKQWIRLSSDLMPIWDKLETFVRQGEMVRNTMEMLNQDPENMRAFIDAMHDKALNAPQSIARIIDLSGNRKLLDIGGGPGTYSLELCRILPGLRATVFEIPPVAEVARDYTRRYGLEDRVEAVNGDFKTDPLPTGYDLVLIANVLHMYPAETARALVQKAAAALEPGGRLIVHGFSTNPDRVSPLEDVIFCLNMGMLTEDGNAHSVPEMQAWLEDAGFGNILQDRIEAIPTCVMTGVLPA
ncbi:MAG: methyltransferase domain-containing protein [Nitrospina sp.]|nr:methyltransferase domain-containing protein [Nitrospina sp.]